MPAAAEVIGIDHVYLTVSAMERSERFYDRLLREEITNFRAERRERMEHWERP
jgi:hypothetical protein